MNGLKKALVVGGNSGVGLAMVAELLRRDCAHVYIVGKDPVRAEDIPQDVQGIFEKRTSFERVDLAQEQFAVFDSIQDVDTLLITAGFGRVAPFEELTSAEVTNLLKCNLLGCVRVIQKYYDKLRGQEDFHCAVMGSIAGHVASPLFSVYGASKMGLHGFIENINGELVGAGCRNRITEIAPGSLKGTNFDGGGNAVEQLTDLVREMLDRMTRRDVLYIPDFDKTYRGVLERYRTDAAAFAQSSYEYKLAGGRHRAKPQVVVGYLSGTFDLFHIGHLNLLRRARQQCDYLIVGVHGSGAWKGKETFIPLDERMAIVGSIQYVDEVMEAPDEDLDAYHTLHYDRLFVGSDYEGTERFQRYEAYFADKDVKIIYFPYTKGTSSTQLRDALKK